MDELIQTVLPVVEPVMEVVAGAPALDPRLAEDTANFAGLVAGDPDATGRYIDNLLRLVELVDDAGRLAEVLPLW